MRAYLEAEIEFVLERVGPATVVLELGCGYGRVLRRLAAKARAAVGIDTSLASLAMARETLAGDGRVRLVAADATRLGFGGGAFDLTVCVQNGISAFGVDALDLGREALRVTKAGGKVLFSSYSARFWPHRLRWFELQAEHGLIGPMDRAATGDGVIVCTDGFRATTVGPGDFDEMARRLGVAAAVGEVAGSSLFCEMVVP